MAQDKNNNIQHSVSAIDPRSLTVSGAAASAINTINTTSIQFPHLDPEQKAQFLDQFTSENYMAITLGYDTGIIVPYEQGRLIMDALQHARVFRPNHSTDFSHVSAKPIKSDTFKTQLVHKEELGQMMLNYILEIGEQ